jgi:ABC-2 type transport system permease protein
MGVVPPVADGITATAATFAAYLLAFLAFVLGASTVGAEFTSGSMSTWLTFQPRRLRTAASKLVAVGLASAALGGVALALLNAGARMVAVVNRPGSDLKIPDPTPLTDSLPQLLARVLVLVVLGGVGGACLALVLRHTSAAVLSVLGYAVAVELVAVQAFLQGRLRPWTVGTNVSAFIEKGGTYLAESCTESECVFTEHTLSYTHAWVYLLVLAVVGVVAGLVAFRRRDVS